MVISKRIPFCGTSSKTIAQPCKKAIKKIYTFTFTSAPFHFGRLIPNLELQKQQCENQMETGIVISIHKKH